MADTYRHSENSCPVCLGDDLEYKKRAFHVESNYFYRAFTCGNCGFKGKEIFSFEYVETARIKED